MTGFLSPANLITSGHLAAGFLAVVLLEQGELGWAAGCVGVAAVCDSVDGLVARFTDSECEVGSELDSLADLVSFGVAPALAVYLSGLNSLPVLGIAACVAYVVCGGWRLARFQVEEESRHRFVGLPIPPAGVIVAVLAATQPYPALSLGIVAILSLLMVSRLPIPTLAELGQLSVPVGRARVKALQAIRK